MTRAEQLAAVDRMAEAAAIVGREKARELANNVASATSDGEDVYQTAYGMIQHRVDCLGMTCSDVAGCAAAMSLAAGIAEARAEEPTPGALTRVLSAMRLCGYHCTARMLERDPSATNLAGARDRLARIIPVVSEEAGLECAEAIRAIDGMVRA